MTKLSFKEIQAKLMQQEARKEKQKTGGYTGDNSIYPFWNNPDGSSATIRFLPDGDDTNDFFWVERLIIKLPFSGIKGQMDSKSVEVQVPSTDMWKPNSCPINAAIRPWWKDASLEDMARKYYRKKSYLFQGFVVQNPNKDDVTPENPIRRFVINPTIFDAIKTILMRQDLENSPTDYENGRDFYLSKTSKGGYSNYASSSWSMKERMLSEDELNAIATHGLYNLSQFLPKKPDEDHLRVMMEMFEASVDGEQYDPERWGNYYRPNGMRMDNDSDSSAVARPAVAAPTTAASIMNRISKPAPAAVADEVPFDVEEPVAAPIESKPKPQTPEEILAMIKRRKQGN